MYEHRITVNEAQLVIFQAHKTACYSEGHLYVFASKAAAKRQKTSKFVYGPQSAYVRANLGLSTMAHPMAYPCPIKENVPMIGHAMVRKCFGLSGQLGLDRPALGLARQGPFN